MQAKLFGLALALLLASAAFAQKQTPRPADRSKAVGSLSGTITGEGAGPLGGVRVDVLRGPQQPPAIEGVTTSFAGRYRFKKIAPGIYSLRFQIPGWRETELDGVVVKPEGVTTADLELAPLPPSPLHPAPEPQLGSRENWWGAEFGEVQLSELPTSRTVWSLLENQYIDTTTQANDVGQIATGTPSLFGAHGASWTENQYLFNGFDASDPYITGKALLDPDYNSMAAVAAVTSDKPASLGASGTNLIIDTVAPPDRLHGEISLFGTGNPLEGSNQTESYVLDAFPGSQRIQSLYDGAGQIGGAIPFGASYTLPAFVAFSTQQLSQWPTGFGAAFPAHADHVLFEVTPYRAGGRRLDVLYAGEQEFNGADGAAYGMSPAAAQIRNDNFHQFQVRFRDALSAKSAWQAGFGVVHAILSSGLEDAALSPSTVDWVFTAMKARPAPFDTLTGSAPLAQSGQRTRYQGYARYSTLLNGLLGSHSISFGGDFDSSAMNNRWFAVGAPGVGPLQQIEVNGAGAEVIEWNTGMPGGARTAASVQNFNVDVEDSWRPARWISFPLGLRLEYSTGAADGAGNRISWATLEPRADVVVPLPLPHFPRIVLMAGWSRYGHQLQGQYFDYGDPTALGGRVFAWDDSNHDGLAQPGEIGQLLRVFGGGSTAIAPGIARPYTDEITLGIDAKLGPRLELHMRGYRRDDHRIIQAVDTGVPLSDYVPETINDPYITAFSNDASYQTLTVYNQKSSTLGQNFATLGNFPGYHDAAEGVKLEAVYHPGKQWEIRGAIMGSRDNAYTPVGNSVTSNDSAALDLFGNNPNTYLNNPGLGYFDRGGQARVAVYYNLPWGIHLGGVVRWTDGLPYAPLLLVTGFNQGPILVRAVPRQVNAGFRADFYASADLRVSRKFPVRKGVLEGALDIFNLVNSHERIVERDIADQPLQGRFPEEVQPPFTARLGVDWRF